VASDIVPIQLSLTDGDVVTLWAPQWREDGEEWEAFLGDDDSLFAFPDVARLAAFVRTNSRHDLADHPAWPEVVGLTVAELTPDDAHHYDLVGVPELVAQDADQWTVEELSEIVGMVRSIADVCDLEAVADVLDAAPGFALLEQGTLPFAGREGGKLWQQLVATVAERWDDVVDAVDELVTTPSVDPAALAAAEKEASALTTWEEADAAAAGEVGDDDGVDDRELTVVDDDDEDGAEDGFWRQVGIEPLRIVTSEAELLTLRCYLDDRPVFLGARGAIDTFGSPGALARYLVDDAEDTDMAALSTWPEVAERAAARELEIEVDPANVVVLTGLGDDLAEGPTAVDPTQLERAVELLLDVAEWAGDDEPRAALAESESLGWLVSFVIRPNPTRMVPGPPFDADAARWRELVVDLEKRLVKR
jgi:hypothetical protein